jgi:hypothetical protein
MTPSGQAQGMSSLSEDRKRIEVIEQNNYIGIGKEDENRLTNAIFLIYLALLQISLKL